MKTRRIVGWGAVLLSLLGLSLWQKRTGPGSPVGASVSSSPQKLVEEHEAETVESEHFKAPINVARTLNTPPDRHSVEGQPALVPPARSDLSVANCPPLIALLGAPGTKPEQEPQMVLDLLNVYLRLLGSYPAGEDNRQFVNALLGANRDKLPLISTSHPRLNSRGEIIDAWGTPFFFHLNSRVSVEVRSAGPDRHFFTADDITAGKTPEPQGQFEVIEGDLPSS